MEASVQCGRVGNNSTATVSSFAIGVQKQRKRRAKRAETPAMTSGEPDRGETGTETSSSNSGEPEDEDRGTSNGEPVEENSDSYDGEPEGEEENIDSNGGIPEDGEEEADTEGEEETDPRESEDKNSDTSYEESEDECSGDYDNDNMNLRRSCVICHQIPSHAPFRCGRLEDIRRGTLLRPGCICPRCCNYRGRNNHHPEDCHLRSREDQNGDLRVQSYLCRRHGSGVHFLLCSFC